MAWPSRRYFFFSFIYLLIGYVRKKLKVRRLFEVALKQIVIEQSEKLKIDEQYSQLRMITGKFLDEESNQLKNSMRRELLDFFDLQKKRNNMEESLKKFGPNS